MEYFQMNYEQFEEAVKEHFQKQYGPETRIDIRSVQKNNGVYFRSLSIMTEGVHVAPAIYLEPFYDSYREGIPFEKVLMLIEQMHLDMQPKEDVKPEFFSDYETVRESFCIKLVNYEKNKKQLEQMPYLPFLDLAIVCYSYMETGFLKNSSIMIYNKHLRGWQITREELFQQAIKNSREKSPELCLKLSEIFGSISEALGWEVQKEEIPMYILTNRRMCDGAAVLCYPDVLKKCAQQMQSDFYLIPSSVHEVLLISCGDSTKEELCRMVKEINEKEISREDMLSDHIYCYSLEKQMLTNMITGEERLM